MSAGKTKYEFEFVGGNTTVIRRTLPDKSEKFVGYIIREVNKPSGTIAFKSYDREGNEVLPPQEKFGEAAVQFENHLRGDTEKTKTVAKPTRHTELKNTRKKKLERGKSLQR